MNIKKIYPYTLNNNRHFGFHSDAKALMEKYTAAALKIALLWTAFLTHFGRVDEALKKILKSAFTRQPIEADAARDEVFSGVNFCC